MYWSEFKIACREIASIAEERFMSNELVMLGTIRKDGQPRISPCELDFADNHLMFGMMWRSPKAMDLLRDPRLSVHSVTCDKNGTDGDVKLYGRAVDIQEPALRTAYVEAIKKRTDWAPDEPEFHIFALDVEEAAFVVFDGKGGEKLVTWTEESGFRQWEKEG